MAAMPICEESLSQMWIILLKGHGMGLSDYWSHSLGRRRSMRLAAPSQDCAHNEFAIRCGHNPPAHGMTILFSDGPTVFGGMGFSRKNVLETSSEDYLGP